MSPRGANWEKNRSNIMKAAESYRSDNGNVDLSKLRNEQPNVYAKISYYFGNTDRFISAMNGFEEVDPGAGTTITRDVVRNRLCYDHLKLLREEDEMTWEDIGKMYDKSKAYMNRLFNDLDKTFGKPTSPTSVEQTVKPTAE